MPVLIEAADSLAWRRELDAWAKSMFGTYSTRYATIDDNTYVIRLQQLTYMDAGEMANLFKIVRKHNLVFSIVVNQRKGLSWIFAVNGRDPDRGSSIDISML